MNGDVGETLDPDVAAEEARVRHQPCTNHAFEQNLRVCKHFAHQKHQQCQRQLYVLQWQ